MDGDKFRAGYDRIWSSRDERLPSKERGCDGKINLGLEFIKRADRLSRKHGKQYGVYKCPHCGGAHLTTKLKPPLNYPPLIHVTKLINYELYRDTLKSRKKKQKEKAKKSEK